MDSDSALLFVASLAREQKLRVIALLCHNITIVSRDTYGDDGGVKDSMRLRSLNEIQHRISAALVALTSEGSSVFPDNALVTMFFTPRDDIHLSRLLVFAFEESAAAVRRGHGYE